MVVVYKEEVDLQYIPDLIVSEFWRKGIGQGASMCFATVFFYLIYVVTF